MARRRVTVLLLHRFEQCRLGLGRGAVDLVGQHQVGEDRALAGTRSAAPPVAVFAHDLRADDVGGHQVGRELDAAEAQRAAPAPSVRTSSVLPRPGTPSSSTWPPANRRDQHLPRTTSCWPTITLRTSASIRGRARRSPGFPGLRPRPDRARRRVGHWPSSSAKYWRTSSRTVRRNGAWST